MSDDSIPFGDLLDGERFTSEHLRMRYPPFTKVDEIHFIDAKGKTWLSASSGLPVKREPIHGTAQAVTTIEGTAHVVTNIDGTARASQEAPDDGRRVR